MIARLRVLLALGALLVLALAPGRIVAADVPQAERTIYVSAVGGNGMPVMDLAQTDFAVKEDNLVRDITKVGRATEPVYYAVLVDTSSGTGNSDSDRSKDASNATDMVQHMRDGLLGFVKVVLDAAPDSKIMLMEFGGAGMVRKDFTSTLADLEPVIPKLMPKPSIAPVLNEALAEASKQLAKVPSRRRVILTINREPTTESSSLDPKLVAEEVRKSGASVWGISVRYGTRQDANREALLKGLAASSGGLRLTLQTPVPLPDYLRSIAANTIVQYAITFTQPAGAPPTKITTVSTTRPGVQLLTVQWSDK